MEAPDIRRKLEDDENKNKKSIGDDSMGTLLAVEWYSDFCLICCTAVEVLS